MKSHLLDVLKKVKDGRVSPEEACDLLKDLPYHDMDFAKIDHHRELRRGFPEIIYGQGKTKDHILNISREILGKGSNLLITRVDREVFLFLKEACPGGVLSEVPASRRKGKNRHHHGGNIGHPCG
jgi:NCAIR mutase (PurE)-related protein